MPVLSLNDFKSQLSPQAQGGKLLGLDISKSVIGLAFADMGSRIVTPLSVLQRGRLADDAVKLGKIINDYDISGLVIGWPLNVDGSEGKRCQAVRDTTAEILKKLPPIKACFFDERWSTAEAFNILDNIGDKSRKSQVKTVDKFAAQLILQAFLDGLS